jgi:phytoene synthase
LEAAIIRGFAPYHRRSRSPETSLDAAYAECRAICERSAKTFSLACRFLPTSKRRAIWAIYAFCRHADDLVDTPDAGGARMALHAWRDELLRAYDGAPRHPIMVAYADVLRTYPLPLQPALDLLSGIEMDLTPRRYEDWDELRQYCYAVASTVGLLTLPVLGHNSPEAADRAVELGLAMQLTNILRDVGEDARLGRVYLPLSEIRRFGYSVDRLMQGTVDDAFRDLIAFQIERARDQYARARPGIGLLDRNARLPVHLASVLYSRILNRIEANDFDVFSQRAHLTLAEKVVHGLLALRQLPSASA